MRIGAALPCLLALAIAATAAGGEQAAPAGPPWTVTEDADWKELEPGLELRVETLELRRQPERAGAKPATVKITAVRIYPKRFAFEALANPIRDGKTLAEVAKARKAPVVSTGAYFGTKDEPVTLDEWAAVLASRAPGGLGLASALNLDGGPSTGLAVVHEKARSDVPAGRLIPQVIVVYKREKALAN